jgi:hypothetical protein
MSTKGQNVTVTLRKVSTGHRVTAFSLDDLNHGYSIATILVRSQEYGRCYAVGTSWQGDVLFNVQPEAPSMAPYQAPQTPQVHAPPPPRQYAYPPQALPQHAAPPQYAPPTPPPPSGYHTVPYRQGAVVEAQFEENDFGPPPGYPQFALPGRR